MYQSFLLGGGRRDPFSRLIPRELVAWGAVSHFPCCAPEHNASVLPGLVVWLCVGTGGDCFMRLVSDICEAC